MVVADTLQTCALEVLPIWSISIQSWTSVCLSVSVSTATQDRLQAAEYADPMISHDYHWLVFFLLTR